MSYVRSPRTPSPLLSTRLLGRRDGACTAAKALAATSPHSRGRGRTGFRRDRGRRPISGLSRCELRLGRERDAPRTQLLVRLVAGVAVPRSARRSRPGLSASAAVLKPPQRRLRSPHTLSFLRSARRAIRAVRLLASDSRIPLPLRWLAVIGVLPVPGPLDETVLLLVAALLWVFYRERLTEAWRRAAVSVHGVDPTAEPPPPVEKGRNCRDVAIS